MTKRDRYAQRLETNDEQQSIPGQDDIYFNTPSPIPDRVSKNALLQTQNQELKEQLAQLQAMVQADSNSLVLQDGSLMVQGFQFSPTGLIAPEGATLESWQEIGLLLFRLEGSIQWLIGDWLAYGEDVAWGDVTEIAEHLGRDRNTLYGYVSVSRSVDMLRRRNTLSFGHHREVISLAPSLQDQALAYAEEHKLSVATFRKWLRGDDQKATPALPEGDDTSYEFVSGEFAKLLKRDPAKAKPQERDQARAVSSEMRRKIEEFDRKWGI